jgi:hypothetical protein
MSLASCCHNEKEKKKIIKHIEVEALTKAYHISQGVALMPFLCGWTVPLNFPKFFIKIPVSPLLQNMSTVNVKYHQQVSSKLGLKKTRPYLVFQMPFMSISFFNINF